MSIYGNTTTNLIIDALQVLSLCLPEFQLHEGTWELSIKHKLWGIFLEHITDLVSPLDDHRLYGMDESTVIAIGPGIKGAIVKEQYYISML